MKHILIVTEANETVASGHLMECIEIANVLLEAGYQISFMVNDDMPQDFQSRILFPYSTYEHDLEIGKQHISECSSDNNIELIIFNFRFIEDDLLQYIRKRFQGIILCIDELGHRHLSCDVIVNPMIDSYYHVYKDVDAKLYAGPEYLVLSRKLSDYHNQEKAIRDTIQQVCISMGGVDPFGTTLKLAKWVPRVMPDVKIDVVLGGGFKFTSELEEIVECNDNFSVYRNIDYIYELFYRADIAFCAGGNTLHELACIGTPAIVIPSMPHEVRNGQLFERRGVGVCLSITHKVTIQEMQVALEQYSSYFIRKKCSQCGKKTVFGKGGDNIRKIVDDFGLWIESCK